jgi:hypothetical protein
MVKLFFYGERQEIDQIPESFYEFKSYAGALYNLDEVDKLTFEYTSDDKNYFILNEESFEKFFLGGTKDTKVNIYSTFEETNYFQNKNKEDEKIVEKKNFKIEDEAEEKIEENEKEENINNNNNTGESDNGSNEIKLPEITKDMVIASIVKQVKENMQKSRILLQEKEKKEEEERKRREKEENERKEKEKEQAKGITEQINNLITNRLDNLKEELINESQIKMSEIISESQLNLINTFEKKSIRDEDTEINHTLSLEEHPGIKCSECGIDPIVGNRYCCVYCKDVNYCEKCEEKNGLIHGHPMYKFKLRIE